MGLTIRIFFPGVAMSRTHWGHALGGDRKGRFFLIYQPKLALRRLYHPVRELWTRTPRSLCTSTLLIAVKLPVVISPPTPHCCLDPALLADGASAVAPVASRAHSRMRMFTSPINLSPVEVSPSPSPCSFVPRLPTFRLVAFLAGGGGGGERILESWAGEHCDNSDHNLARIEHTTARHRNSLAPN